MFAYYRKDKAKAGENMYAESMSYTQRTTRIHRYTDAAGHIRDQDLRRERRILNNRIRRQQELKKSFLLLCMTMCLIIAFSFTLSVFRSDAKGDPEVSYKYYRSIAVSSEDTLWSIAQEYMEPGYYDSVDDYIREVKSINSLSNDSIRYGDYLVIPYYDSSLVR